MGSLYEIALEVAKGVEEMSLNSGRRSKELIEQGKELISRD